jgi:hypothetical protein
MTKIYAQPSPVVKAMTTILFIHAQPSPGVVVDIHKTQQPIAVLALLRISSWATDAAQEHAAPVFYYVCAEGSSCASSSSTTASITKSPLRLLRGTVAFLREYSTVISCGRH